MPYIRVTPVINTSVRGLCCRRYPGHPKGCPNFAKRATCPPEAPLLADTLDLSQPVYAVYNRFDFAGHVAKMQSRHPDWSERQVRCVLYWQGTARKHLREEIRMFLLEHGKGLRVIGCPEAQGCEVTATMAYAGIELEWPPVTYAHQIAFAGTASAGEDDIFPVHLHSRGAQQ